MNENVAKVQQQIKELDSQKRNGQISLERWFVQRQELKKQLTPEERAELGL
jgi:hypothetical protein